MDAESAVVQYEDKIKKLLEKFLEPNFEIRNDTYLNMLVSHLSGKDNKDLGDTLINLPIFTDWLFKSIQYWEENEIVPSTTVTTFTMYLSSLLSKNETRFIALNSCNVYVRLILALRVRQPGMCSTVKLAYVKLLASFLNHKSGTEWLIATNNWQDCFSDCLFYNQSAVLLKEAHNFMYNLLVKSSQYNKVFCHMIIDKIMLIFNDLHFTNSSISEANEQLVQKKITPTLRLISYILESCLQSDQFTKKDYDIPSIFVKNCHLEQNVWNIIMIGVQNDEFLYDLDRLMILNHFFLLAMDSETEIFQYKDVKKMIENVFKLIKMHLAKSSSVNILKMCCLLHYYWKLIGSRVSQPQINYDPEKSPLLVENQLIILQLMPVFVVSYNFCDLNWDECCDDVFRDHFIMKVFKAMCEHTIRMVYHYRTVLANDKDVFGNAQKALMYLMKSRKFFHRDRAVITFQSLMYGLKDVRDVLIKKPESIEIFIKNSGYLAAHLNVMATFIKEFDLTWRETVETICVMNASVDMFGFGAWPPEVIVQILKLINMSIERFMTPNLALLVDRTSDSSMAMLGPILTEKLHDSNWEVRDGALEVLYTVSNIAHSKFPSFQNMILEFSFPTLAISMSMCDAESFVRASAIKCLQEMIKVQTVWKQTLEQQQLPQKMMHIIYNEPAAIVRCEASTLMCRIYEHQKFPSSLSDEVDEAMVHAATSDLHWEVKSSSLCYWSKAITNRLANQGMIDGSFPSVTFSREKRKIVTLTEPEIRSRLQRVLVELSNCGCLYVLLTTIEDCELEVAKKAIMITKKLAELLNSHAVSSCTTPTSPKAVMDTFNLVSSSPTYVNGESKTNPFHEVFIKQEPLSPASSVSTNGIKNEMHVISPKEFLSYIQRDLDEIIVERKRWINDLDGFCSLLDDLTRNHESQDNCMECKIGQALINRPIFTDWLFLATQHWESTQTQPSPNVTTFTIHLASLLSKNETRFISLNACNIYVRLVSALGVRTTSSPSIKLAYIKLLASFLNHKSGTEWIVATNNWQDVLKYCMECQTIYLVREGQNFIYDLLVNTSARNQVFCSMIIEKIMFTFNNIHCNGSVVPEVNDEILQKKLTPTIRLISHILEKSLQSESFVKMEYDVPNMFLKNCHLEQNVWNIIMMGGQNTELLFDLNKLTVLCYFFILAIDSEDKAFKFKDVKRMFENILKLLKMHIARNDIFNILKLANLLQYYWTLVLCRLDRTAPEYQINTPILFENQVLIFQVIPFVVISHSQCKSVAKLDDEMRDDFITKVLKIMCEHTLRLAYQFREILTADKNIFENSKRAVMYIMKSRKYYDRDRAIIIFQFLMYVLEDVTHVMKEYPISTQGFIKEANYFVAHFDALATFIEEFELTWRDSVETICVMNVTMEFLGIAGWPPYLVVQALKLVNLSIVKFMTPNLALLVDKTSDSALAYLGPMLTAKLHDVNWEVRDSALEVLHTMSNIAHTKFPSFQNVVLECDLPPLMVTMSTCDSESFVRASAIKCLQEMIKIPVFWETALDQQKLPEKMIDILYNETEAIVRCETASLMYEIYEHQSFPKQLEDKVHEVMVHATVSDLHWEVKAKALCYWKQVIDKLLTHEGMIDGSFPTVTFSKEHRKIVTLTEPEIKTRLLKILDELSKCGCLSVLVTAMQDECDLEVAKKAVEITKKLVSLLKTYSVTGDTKIPTPTTPKAVMDTFNLANTSSPSARSSDDVIDEIVSCRDVNLLTEVYVKDEDDDPASEDGFKSEMKRITPKEFLSFIQKDLDSLVVKKAEWLNEIDNLGSLLDDVLKTYEDTEVNAMDCY